MEAELAWRMMALAFSFRMARCLQVAVELGVPDAIDESPRPVGALAAALGVNAGALDRLMMALVSGGVFEREDGGYVHTPGTRLMRTDHPRSLAGFTRFAGSDYNWAAWGGLDHSVRTGETAFDHLYGCNSFEFYAREPLHGRIFDQAMSSKAEGDNRALVQAYDFTPFGRVADIGGGRGHLLRTVLTAAPAAEGVLFDLPDVVEGARALGGERIDFVGGDFFNDPMPTADVYTFMMILHDWSDEACVAILRNLRRTAPETSRLLVVESVLAEGGGTEFARLADIQMMVLTGGRERTQRQYADLFARGGFRLNRDAIPTAGEMSIVEAVPA